MLWLDVMVTPKSTKSSILRQQSSAGKRNRNEPVKLRDYTSSRSTPQSNQLNKNKKLSAKKKRKEQISKQASTDADLCNLCGVVCTTECIECSKCHRWFHNSCVLIEDRDNTLFDLCNITFNCIFCLISSVHNKVSLEKVLSHVKKQLSSLEAFTIDKKIENSEAIDNDFTIVKATAKIHPTWSTVIFVCAQSPTDRMINRQL